MPSQAHLNQLPNQPAAKIKVISNIPHNVNHSQINSKTHPIPLKPSNQPFHSKTISHQNTHSSTLRQPKIISARSNRTSPSITAKLPPNLCPPRPQEPIRSPLHPFPPRPGHARTRSTVSTGPSARLSPHIPPPTPRLRADTPSDLSSSLRLASHSQDSLSVSLPSHTIHAPVSPHPLPIHPPLAPALAIRRTSHTTEPLDPAERLSPRSPTNSLAVDWSRRAGSTAPSSPPSLHDGQADELETCAHDEARVHRKVLDLEISNASLLAINAALERTKVKQAAEIRSLRARLAEQALGPVGPCSEPCSSSDGESGDAGDLAAEDAAFGEVVRLLEGLIGNASRALVQRPEAEGGKKVLSSVEVEDLESTKPEAESQGAKNTRPSNLAFGSGSSPVDGLHTQQLHLTPAPGLVGTNNALGSLNSRAGSRPASPSVKTLAGMFNLSSH